MPTAGIINTTKLAIFVGSVKVALATDASMEVSLAERDTTTKDTDGGWAEFEPGLASGSFTLSALYAMDAALGMDDLFDAMINRTQLSVMFTTNETGDKKYVMTGYIMSLSCNSPGAEENASWTTNIKGRGIEKELVA